MTEREALQEILSIAETGIRSYQGGSTADFSTEDLALMKALAETAGFAREAMGEADPQELDRLRSMSPLLNPQGMGSYAQRRDLPAVGSKQLERLRGYSAILGPGSRWAREREQSKAASK